MSHDQTDYFFRVQPGQASALHVDILFILSAIYKLLLPYSRLTVSKSDWFNDWQTDRQTSCNTHISEKSVILKNTHKNADVADLTVILRSHVQAANNILLTSVSTLLCIDVTEMMTPSHNC